MFTADAHCDTLLQLERGFEPLTVNRDLLRAGGVGLQVFALFNGDPPPLTGGIARARRQMALLEKLGIPLLTGPLPEQPPREPAAIFSIEGAEILEDDPGALEPFRDRGVRLVNLCWNHENALATPALRGRGGLKPLGRTLLAQMGRLGVMADVSHLNEDGFWEVLEASTLPVAASHSCARALCPHPRNLTDRQIRALIGAGGFMGINFCPAFLEASGPATLESIVRHIDHVAQLGGIGILGMGSDFDGIDSVPAGMEDASCFPALWEALERRGYGQQDMAAIAGLNFWRILKKAEGGSQ